jgi:rhodanese-related sulfurtransferase
MPNLLDISISEVTRRLEAGEEFTLLDVREADELRRVSWKDRRVVHVPLSLLARQGPAALPVPLHNKAADIVVFCHMGSRSMQVAAWLASQGWTKVKTMTGGIDGYARRVDPSMGFY